MATERWFNVKIEMKEENDGAVLLRKGPEGRTALLSVNDAARQYTSATILQALHRAIEELSYHVDRAS